MSPSVRPAGPHGGDGRAVATSLGLDPDQIIDLSASLNPFAPDVGSALARHLDAVGAYPDADAASVLLADAIGVEPDVLLLTNGGAEGIALVAAEVGRGAVVEPEFSLYRRHLPVVDDGAPRWRSNPSNPLGRLAGAGDRAGLWDEAFYPLATGCWTAGARESWRLGSLTKLWACPGLRLGYVIAPDATARDRIAARQPRWSVNGLAVAAMPELLAGTDLASWATAIRAQRAQFAAELTRLDVTVEETEAPWVLVDEPDLRTRLAPTGVVVRDLASFGLPGRYRVALPRPADIDRVLAAFASVMTTR